MAKNPGQSYSNTLNVLKGWDLRYSLTFRGILHPDVDVTTGPNNKGLPAGRCVHVEDTVTPPTGNAKFGNLPRLATGVTGTQMGLFVFPNSNDDDVVNDGEDAGGTVDWWAIAPTGVLFTFVASGAFELETTEYDSGQTYLPNDALRAIPDDASLVADTGGGNLSNDCTVYIDAIVGVVSRGTYTNSYGKSVLAFWPVYLPADPNAVQS